MPVNKKSIYFFALIAVLLVLLSGAYLFYNSINRGIISNPESNPIFSPSPQTVNSQFRPSPPPSDTPITETIASPQIASPSSTPIKDNFSHKFYMRIPFDWNVTDKEGRTNEKIPNASRLPNVEAFYTPEGDYRVEGIDVKSKKIDYTIYGDGRFIEVEINANSPIGTTSIDVTKSLNEASLIIPYSTFSVEIDREYPEVSKVAKLTGYSYSGRDIKVVFDGEKLSVFPTKNSLQYTVEFFTGRDNDNISSKMITKKANEIDVLKPDNWNQLPTSDISLEIDNNNDGIFEISKTVEKAP